jgi:ribosomal protein S18 acetylase RimI-like enzyme
MRESFRSQIPSNESRVRRGIARDLDRVCALWTLISDHHRALGPSFRLRPAAEAEIHQLLAAMLRDPDCAFFVFEGDGDLHGLAIVRIDRAPPIHVETARAEITDVGVRAAHRRRGIGSALVARALAWIRERGVERVEVRVAHANAEGQAFWRAQGFGDLMDVLERRL